MAKNSGQAKFEACMVLSGVGDAIGYKNHLWRVIGNVRRKLHSTKPVFVVFVVLGVSWVSTVFVVLAVFVVFVVLGGSGFQNFRGFLGFGYMFPILC